MTRLQEIPEPTRPHAGDTVSEPARRALGRATERLLAEQDAAGFWCGELEGDSILQSEYILLKFIVGQEDDPRLGKIGNYLREHDFKVARVLPAFQILERQPAAPR